jgi:hypothetical protein
VRTHSLEVRADVEREPRSWSDQFRHPPPRFRRPSIEKRCVLIELRLRCRGIPIALLGIFHDDPSPTIRERAACSLAQSGMLSRLQRRTAVPRLIEYAHDGALDAQTRGWVFQALRDITGQTLPRETAAWREWQQRQR